MHSLALGEISTPITKGATPTTYGFEWQASGVPFLRSECVSEKGLDMRQSMFISSEAHASLQRSQVVEGDILLTITGNIGRVVQLEGIEEANINQHIARVRVIDDRLHPRYVFHYLSQRAVRQYYESITTGQAYPQISLAQVRSTAIPLISKIEQKEIVAALDDADMLISSLEHLISKKQAIKQGMMQELLTGRTRLPGFTAEWKESRLGSFGTFLKGRGIKRDEIQSRGVPCIRYGELYTTFENYTEQTASFVSDDIAATALPIRYGDILFAGSGETKAEIGTNVAYLGKVQAVAGGDIIVFRGISHNPVFLSSLLNSPAIAAQKARAGQGDAIVHIHSSSLAEIVVNVPPIEEQEAIAQILQDADKEIAALDHRLETARSIKTGMMQELLTGRTRLPVEEVSS